MKAKFKSLVFWAIFFSLLTCLMFWGVFFLINIESLYYFMGRAVEILGYLFITIYVIFSVLIFTNKFPKKIEQFEKFRYLAVMFILLLVEITVIGTALPDLDWSLLQPPSFFVNSSKSSHSLVWQPRCRRHILLISGVFSNTSNGLVNVCIAKVYTIKP